MFAAARKEGKYRARPFPGGVAAGRDYQWLMRQL
jgi:hypothetical protein